jgi:hypothetical protein
MKLHKIRKKVKIQGCNNQYFQCIVKFLLNSYQFKVSFNSVQLKLYNFQILRDKLPPFQILLIQWSKINLLHM